jgi:hypothetical protein
MIRMISFSLFAGRLAYPMSNDWITLVKVCGATSSGFSCVDSSEDVPAEFTLDYASEKLGAILKQIHSMIEADLLPQYVQFVGVSDRPTNNNNSNANTAEKSDRSPAYLILKNTEDFTIYSEKRNIIEAVFIKSTRLSFSSSEEEC